MLEGMLIRLKGGFYTVLSDSGDEYTLRCKKKFRHQHMTPLVGDRVQFTPGEGEEHGWLEEILPRISECLRPPVANVELLLIVVAPEPAPDLLLVDRLLIRARAQNIGCMLVVNKCDLDGGALAAQLAAEYKSADVSVTPVCAATGEGTDTLRTLMREHLCCFTGQSGVGKSTLLSGLLHLELETGELSEKIRRGKNTTRHAEYLTDGEIRALDTAGFSLLELDGKKDPITLKDDYPDFLPYEGLCRFQPCYHDREPGCAVTQACEEGHIHPERLRRYRELLADVKTAWRERYD